MSYDAWGEPPDADDDTDERDAIIESDARAAMDDERERAEATQGARPTAPPYRPDVAATQRR